jgi:hypothetical protein
MPATKLLEALTPHASLFKLYIHGGGVGSGRRSLAAREKFHASTTIDNRCNRFGDGVGSGACLQDVMRGILSNKNLYND